CHPPKRDCSRLIRLSNRLLQSLGGGSVDVLPLALAQGALVPGHAEPFEVAQDLLLAAGYVARRVGVVDPEQEPVAEIAVGDSAQSIADVQRASGAGCEADARHCALNLHSRP